MDFKTMAVTATLGGTILLSGLTFTGTIDLASIKGFGQDWASKITQAVDNSKQMASKFSLFKSDVESQINEKIAKINELNARISELGDQVASGAVNLEDANNEIARLNEELDKANQEVQALKNEFALKDSEVQSAFAEMATADSLDTNMNLATQNPDAVAPEDTTPIEPTEQPQEPTQEEVVYNAMTSKYSGLEELQVIITDTTVTLIEPNLKDHDGNNYGATFTPDIEQALGIDITSQQKVNETTFKYNY